MSRLPIIRHIRWAWGSWRVHRWARQCASVGLGLGILNQAVWGMLEYCNLAGSEQDRRSIIIAPIPELNESSLLIMA